VTVKDGSGQDDPNATFFVSIARREEKGSDGNVASHLIDILTGLIDAALVISNDSDLKFPVDEAHRRVPVGTIDPTKKQTAGKLRGSPAIGVGNHWWYQLTPTDFYSCQLPDPAGGVPKPTPW
jgi:hypothetical protein